MAKRITAILLTACLVLGLAGCGKEGQTKETSAETGRYVEKQIELPDNINASRIFQVSKADDKLLLYTVENQAGQFSFASSLYEDGAFKTVTPDWLAGLSFKEDQMNQYVNRKVIENVGGKSYFYTILTENESWIGHLYCSTDGKTTQEITPADWLIENEEYHFYECPQDIVVLEDGTLIAYFSYMIRIYDAATYTMTKEIMLDGQHSEQIYADKDSYYLIAQSDYLEFKGVERYQPTSDKPIETFTTDTPIGSGNYLDLLSDGSIALTGKDGILQRDAASGQWTQVMNGIYASFGLESMWCGGMAALDSGLYYALFHDETENAVLMEYSYDPNAVQKPETTLTVYSVYDNAVLNQAAAMYSKQNPSVLVEVESSIAYGEEQSADMNAILQSLNTKLIAGEGADILVLDGLDTDSFVEKGLLTDISEQINPMVQDGTLLKNITDSYLTEDGKMYMVPLKFSMNLLIGDKLDATKAGTMQGMAQEIAKQDEPVFGPMTAQDFANDFAPYIVQDIVDGKVLNKEKLSENLEYMKVIAENGGFIDAYDENTYKWNIWDVPAVGGAAFYDAAGFLQSMFPMAIVKFANCTFTSFNNSFKPVGQMSINASCKNMDVANDFLKYALSFPIQDGDYYDGFPINVEALENQITKDRTNYAAETSIETEDGSYVQFIIDAITPENAQKLVELCKQVDQKVVTDAKIQEVIAQELPAYVNGSNSLEDTVNKIEKGLNMYLAE